MRRDHLHKITVFKNVRDDLTADGLLQNVSEYVYSKEELFHQSHYKAAVSIYLNPASKAFRIPFTTSSLLLK